MMSVEMNAERFAALAEAFGGDLRRWPEAERASAMTFLAAEPAAAEPVLDAARRLDTALDSALNLYPSPALRDRVLASAPRPGERVRHISWSWGWGWNWSVAWTRSWLAPGAGLAAACVAGAWIGLLASHNAGAQLRADTVLVASADLSAGDLEAQ